MAASPPRRRHHFIQERSRRKLLNPFDLFDGSKGAEGRVSRERRGKKPRGGFHEIALPRLP